jgi:hypothetical protein
VQIFLKRLLVAPYVNSDFPATGSLLAQERLALVGFKTRSSLKFGLLLRPISRILAPQNRHFKPELSYFPSVWYHNAKWRLIFGVECMVALYHFDTFRYGASVGCTSGARMLWLQNIKPTWHSELFALCGAWI